MCVCYISGSETKVVTVMYVFRPQTKFTQVMFSQVVVCPCGGGGSRSLSKGVSVQGAPCPPYGNKRAVRILLELECILIFSGFSDAFMINLALVLGFTAYITLYPFQWLEDLLEVCSCFSYKFTQNLMAYSDRQSLNGIRTGNIDLLYIMLNFLTAIMRELKQDWEHRE